jgi:glycerophosphoryl diester phosphodiesterase
MPGVWNIAHRGASLDRPENTLAAFEEAIRQGADVIEADVRATADGELLIINDPRFDRTTDGNGAVAEVEYARARRLDAGRGERIPTPDEVLELARGRARVTFDIKDIDVVPTLVAMVDELGMAGSVTFLTPDPEVAARLLADAESIPVMQSVDAPAAVASLVTGHATAGPSLAGIAIPSAMISTSVAERVRRHGWGLFAWTVDEPEEMSRLLDCGVDGILTNRPGVLAGLLRARGLERD